MLQGQACSRVFFPRGRSLVRVEYCARMALKALIVARVRRGQVPRWFETPPDSAHRGEGTSNRRADCGRSRGLRRWFGLPRSSHPKAGGFLHYVGVFLMATWKKGAGNFQIGT